MIGDQVATIRPFVWLTWSDKIRPNTCGLLISFPDDDHGGSYGSSGGGHGSG